MERVSVHRDKLKVRWRISILLTSTLILANFAVAMTGPPTARADDSPTWVNEAVAWAQSQLANPSQDWRGDCLSFCNDTYQDGAGLHAFGVGAGWGSAQAMATYYQAHGLFQSGTPPTGAWVFWLWPAGATWAAGGHVAFSTGGGNLIEAWTSGGVNGDGVVSTTVAHVNTRQPARHADHRQGQEAHDA
jgi:hypothetical protein